MSQIVLLGATGFTGRLTAAALQARGLSPLLAGRSAERLAAVAGELGGLEHRVVTPTYDDVRGVLAPGDVLITAVGPYTDLGDPVIAATVDAGAHYLDCCGESGFHRDVFERYGPRAEQSGSSVFTGFGADWVPGNLAGALALRAGGDGVARLEVRYASTGPSVYSLGSKATGDLLRANPPPSFAWRGGAMVVDPEPASPSFDVGDGQMAFPVSTTEHYALPRLAAGLERVDVFMVFGPPAPGDGAPSQGDGPTAAERAANRQSIVAFAFDRGGDQVAAVHLEGANGYEYTAEILAWGAGAVAAGLARGPGALGPVDGFGLETLLAGSIGAGLGPSDVPLVAD
jgi:hypothetical protein